MILAVVVPNSINCGLDSFEELRGFDINTCYGGGSLEQLMKLCHLHAFRVQ